MRPQPPLPLFFALCALLALVPGCDRPPPLDMQLNAAQLPQNLGDPCPTTPGGAPFEAEIAGLTLEVMGPAATAPITAQGAVGESVVADGIPEGSDYVLSLNGTNAGGTTVWRGVRTGVEVKAGEMAEVDVLMTKPGQVSCPRAPQTSPRAFHTASALPDGRVVIVGGAQEAVDASSTCGGCKKLTARAEVEIYDPGKGTFTSLGLLTAPRMFHAATVLDENRILISGGSSEALIDPNQKFPIRPTGPWSSLELIDVSSGSVGEVGSDPAGARVFHTSTLMGDGSVLLVGGVPGQSAAANDLTNALSTTTRCASSNLACENGPTMKRPRAGHAAFLLESGQLILWGGSVNYDAVDGVAGYQLETLATPADASFVMLNTQAMAYTRNLFFAAWSRYRSFRVVAGGGFVREGDGTFAPSQVEGNSASTQASVFIFDAQAGNAGGISTGTVDPDERPPMGLPSRVVFASAAPLPDQSRAVMGGGFSDLLTLTPSDQLSLFDESTLTVTPLVTLRQARGGTVATAVGNGTVLFTGGVDASGVPLATAEIFTDPKEVTP